MAPASIGVSVTKGVSRLARDPRAIVLAGITLAYVWRFHILAPQLELLRLSAIMTLAAWGYLLIAPGGATFIRGARRPFVIFYVLLLAWALIGHPFGLWPEGSLTVLQDVHLRNALFLLFILGTVNSVGRLKVALGAHVLGAAVLAFYYIKGGTPTEWTPVSTYDRNDLALLFNMSLPLVLWFGMEHPARSMRRLLGVLALALTFSVVMSQSRGGFLGLGVILAILLLAQKTIRLRYRVAPIAIITIGWFFLPSDVTDRLGTLTSLQDDYNIQEATGRVEIWKRGISYLADRPVFGVGLGNFSLAEATLSEESRQFAGRWKASVAHNSYIEILVETGFLGGLFYAGTIGSMLVGMHRTRRRLEPFVHAATARTLHRLSGFVLASVLGFAFGSFFLSTFNLSLLVALMANVGASMTVMENVLSRAHGKDVHQGTRRSPRRVWQTRSLSQVRSS